MIKLIEVEVYNFCNRRCSFCPNSLVPSRQDQKNLKILDYNKFCRLVDQLKEINYRNTISFSRYNEPLAFYNITKKYVEYIRNNLNCLIVSNTNGDYLNNDVIELFDELTIMDYAGKGEDWWKKKLSNLNLYFIDNKSNDEFLYFETTNKKSVLIFLNFKKNATIEDRGGVIKLSRLKYKNQSELRTRPCLEPEKFLGIDYTGDVMVCCNMNSEFHNNYSIGNIYNHNLSEILNSEKRKHFIDIMSQENYLNFLDPCKNCQKDPGRYTRDNPGIFYNGERK